MDISTEIRKLPRENTVELVRILEYGEQWKRIMAIIPKILEKDDYRCDITPTNRHKYVSEQFIMIEEYARKSHRKCTDILFDEWGTSGRVRPTIGHLLYLLLKEKLFRAADYVSINILGLPPPERPTDGPPARISLRDVDLDTTKIEGILNEIDYPSSAIEKILQNSIDTNINYSTKESQVIPKIIISDPPPEDPLASFTTPSVIPRNIDETSDTVSDMIKFSEPSVEIQDTFASQEVLSNANVPNFSLIQESQISVNELGTNSDNCDSTSNVTNYFDSEKLEDSEANIPNVSVLNQSYTNNIDQFSGMNIPDFNQIGAEASSTNTSSTENCISSPNFSALNNLQFNSSTTDQYPSESETNLPAFSQLLIEQKTEHNANVSETEGKSRTCVSPLPNLSLNTLLPHFNYWELEATTNDFDETHIKDNGRFLGAGAYGKVFLALGLYEKPVAVKKLNLDSTKVVEADDTITKQFRNEVEVLSKYKHENLVAILGYSCDGCTYCLLYEYLEGGALKDRLQNKDHKLMWTERIYIAIGTAKAISHLHTAFSPPLIHRDIKTANILLDHTNKPKLCDFGLIKLSPNQNTNTATTVFGTSAYMAPEAFRGDISVKLDTFSFGVVLLELLTSLVPYDQNREGGHDLITYIENKCENDINPLLDISAGTWIANKVNFAEKLYNIANKCLEDKKKRPNMIEVTEQLIDLTEKSL